MAKPPSELADNLVSPIFIVLAATYKESHFISGDPRLNVSFADGNILPATIMSPDIVLFGVIVLLTINLFASPIGIVSVE